MKNVILFLWMILCITKLNAQNITGKVLDEKSLKPISEAVINIPAIKSTMVTNEDGLYTLSKIPEFPLSVYVNILGFEPKEIQINKLEELQTILYSANQLLEQVVVSASRVEEKIIKSPITIEKLSRSDIQNTASSNYYDALIHLKGLDMITSGITYKQINTRGFNTTGNSRFLQLVDGVDNQSPGLGFSPGNFFGSSDLDVESVELIPGAASALYGPVAFNGLLNITTKNPFKYQGLSVETKIGINHLGETDGSAQLYSDLSFRYAKSFGSKFAFKINGSYLKATDWYAQDYTDIDPNTPQAQRGSANPGRNALNIYGDEVAKTIQGVGRVSRTGYEEKDLMEYDVYGTKISTALHYKINSLLEAIYQFNFNQGVGNYTGSSRFCLNNFTLIQNRIELRSKNFFIRGYSSGEQSKDSYNSRSLGQLINRSWVTDLNGTTVTPDQADATWFTKYEKAYKGEIANVSAQNHDMARAYADAGRLIPGSSAFNEQKEKFIHTAGLGGAGVSSDSKFYHVDGQYDFSNSVKFINLLLGGSYRNYDMETHGTLFDDKVDKVRVNEFGVFVQLSKEFLNHKLKLSTSGRYDKNENFDGNFTPRASIVFSPTEKHNFRASFQTGFRNPTVPDQFIKLNVGPIIILGGAPANSKGLNAYENSFTSSSVGAFASGFAADLNNGLSFPEAVAKNKDKLIKSNVPYIRPEESTSYELGYKSVIANGLLLDANYYYSRYTNFLINQVVIRTDNNVLTENGSVNISAAQDILNGKTQAFQLYTNAKDVVDAQGIGIGLSYQLPKKYRIATNLTWSSFNLRDANPNNIPAFNTPEWKTNLVFSNTRLTKNIGFSIAWHWQSAFDWYGTFTQNIPGQVKAYHLLDAQISYRIPEIKTTVKLAANNLTNQYITQAYGSPSVGGLYFVSLVFDELFK